MERIERIITSVIEDIKKKLSKKPQIFETKEEAILSASTKFLEGEPPRVILNLPPAEEQTSEK